MTRGAAARLIASAACAPLQAAAACAPIQTPAAHAPIHASTACVPIHFRPDGVPAASPTALQGPGLVLSGAGDLPDAGLHWMRALLGPPGGRAGNVVVLRASGDRYDTDDFYQKGRFASVREILVPPCATRAALDATARDLANADAVYFAGGDQAHYAAWKGSALIAAVRAVRERGGIVGGGSAGLAIQGAVVYDAVAADRIHGDSDYSVDTANATHTPLEPEISFTTGLFDWAPLRRTITDTHFAARDRFGRLVAFLARIVHAGLAAPPVYGLGIDQGSVVLVDAGGSALLRRTGKSRGAYLVRLSEAVRLVPGRPLLATVDVARIGGDGERFDLTNKHANAPLRPITVNGARVQPYSEDPYA